MFWGGFGAGIRSELVVCKGDMESKKGGVSARRYLEILEEHLETIMDHDSVFMQDNAPIHMAKIILDFFEDMGYEVMKWPPYSPDLNPIENLWKLLKAKIIQLAPELETFKDNDQTRALLIHTANIAWNSIEDTLLEKLALKMQKRVTAVIQAKGWYTKY